MSRQGERLNRDVLERLESEYGLTQIYQGQPPGAMEWNHYDSGRSYFVGFFNHVQDGEEQKVFARLDSSSKEAEFADFILSQAPHLMGEVMPHYHFSGEVNGSLNVRDSFDRPYYLAVSQVIEPNATLDDYILVGMFTQSTNLSVIPLIGSWALQSNFRIYRETTTSQDKGYIPTDRKPENCLVPVNNPKILQIDFGEASREMESVPGFFSPGFVPLTFFQKEPLLNEKYLTSQAFAIIGHLYLETFKQVTMEYRRQHPHQNIPFPTQRYPFIIDYKHGVGKSAYQELSDLFNFESNPLILQEGMEDFRKKMAKDFLQCFDEYFAGVLQTQSEFKDYQALQQFGDTLKHMLSLGYGYRGRYPDYAESLSILDQLHQRSRDLTPLVTLPLPPPNPDRIETTGA